MKLRILSFAMLLLSLAVLNWGMQYKMSLYQHSHSESSLHAPAKLWTGSKDEIQLSASNFSLPVDQQPMATQTALISFFAVTLQLIKNDRARPVLFATRGVNTPWQYRCEFSHTLFFRPPPIQ